MRGRLVALGVFVVFVALVLISVSLSGPEPSGPEPSRTQPLSVRGVYGLDSSPSGFSKIKEAGFNVVTANPSLSQLDAVAASGLKAQVGLGAYDKSTCSFVLSDAFIAERLREVRGHPAIAAFKIADEPNAHICPEAPRQIKERSELVASTAPGYPTVVTVSAWNGVELHPYEDFAGTADILGLVVYPCTNAKGCRLEQIDTAIAEAESDNVTRYWAIIQAFDGMKRNDYEMPTAVRLRQQFTRWAESDMEGYFVYSWGPPAPSNLEEHPALIEVLTQQNARRF